MVTRGFTGRQRSPDIAKRLPPGQSLTEDFPVLSAGPTPHVRLDDWSFTLKVGPRPIKRWKNDRQRKKKARAKRRAAAKRS